MIHNQGRDSEIDRASGKTKSECDLARFYPSCGFTKTTIRNVNTSKLEIIVSFVPTIVVYKGACTVKPRENRPAKIAVA
jgi:hypothetical protein